MFAIDGVSFSEYARTMIASRDRAALALFDASGRHPGLALTEPAFLALLAAIELQLDLARCDALREGR